MLNQNLQNLRIDIISMINSRISDKDMLTRKLYAVCMLCIIITSAVMYSSCAADNNSKKQTEESGGLSKDLVRANELTQSIYDYVEMVETKQMTQEESARLSAPIKQELAAIRGRLSKEDLMYNDSIRKAMGNVMVSKVMKWREENGLVPPEGQ